MQDDKTPEDHQAAPAVGPRLERGVRRPAPKRNKPLSYRQRDVLAKAPADWGKLPGGIGCTNASLEALERRGLVETRYGIAGGFVVDGRQYLGWQWRKTPNAKLNGRPPGRSV